ncbi:MAG TPA: HEAT repeat domain-containing protein [Candidatus Obscuribacterales bacterium]
MSIERYGESTEAAGRDGSSPASPAGWLAELIDREERTLGGCVVGVVRDLLDRGQSSQTIRSARARSNDEVAHIAADTVAFLPSLKWTAGGAIRGALLLDPHRSASDNLSGFGKNFLEGAALNCVGKLAAPNSAFARATAARLGNGLLAESATHLTVGLGLGTVKSGFNLEAWKDASGSFSVKHGLENMVLNGGIAAAVNLPAGMIGFRISKAATVAVGRDGLSPKVGALISGAGSGYAGGIVFGGIEGVSAGKDWQGILSSMHKGGLVGAFTGGFVQGFQARAWQRQVTETASARPRRPELPAELQPVLEPEAPAAPRGDKTTRTGKPADTAGRAWYDKTLDIRPRVLNAEERLALSGRLLRPRVIEATMDAPRQGVEGPFKDYKDFSRRAVKEVKAALREYEVEGHSTRILVGEEYARQLDQVRQLRQRIDGLEGSGKSMSQQLELIRLKDELSRHRFGSRALPEDFIPYLDQLPDRRLVRRLIIVDGPSAEDAWMKQAYKPDFTAAATASPDGDVIFYSPHRHAPLRDQLFHEWAHLVKFKFGSESQLFNIAADLEKGGHFSSDYARFSDHENFAVHMGEDMLHWDADTFALITDQAPLRSVIFGRALARTFQSLPSWARSIHHKQFNARLAYLNNEVLPRAQELLVTTVHNGDANTRKLALQLLGPLGNKSHLELLVPLARKSQNLETAELALDAALQIAHRNGREVDLLLEVGRPGSAVRDTAIDLMKRMRDYRAPSYWRLLELSGDPRSIPELVNLIDTMPDLQGKKLAFAEAMRLARQSGDMQAIGRLMLRAPDVQAKKEAFDLILDHLSGKGKARVEFALRTLQKDADLREPALAVLAAAGDAAAQKQVQKLTGDGDPHVASLARKTLDAIGRNAEFDTLTARLRVGLEQDRIFAARQLGQFGELRAIRPLLEAAATGPSAVRAEAATALENFSPMVVKFEVRQLLRQRPELRPQLEPMLRGYRPAM